MDPTNIIWTNEEYDEYARQLQLIEESYGGSVPRGMIERMAAEAVNNLKKQKI